MDYKIKKFRKEMKVGRKKGRLKTKLSYNEEDGQKSLEDY